MLTTIVATPRTGSTTLWKSLKSQWWPKHHPIPLDIMPSEYYTGIQDPRLWRSILPREKYLENIKAMVTLEQLHSDLLEHVYNNPDSHVVVKVFPFQVSARLMHDLIATSSRILHSLRKSYTDQLKSYVAATATNRWNGVRPTCVDITQDMVDFGHSSLIHQIVEHSKIFHKYGGELSFLEDRYDAREKYLETTINHKLCWPSFDTASAFTKN